VQALERVQAPAQVLASAQAQAPASVSVSAQAAAEQGPASASESESARESAVPAEEVQVPASVLEWVPAWAPAVPERVLVKTEAAARFAVVVPRARGQSSASRLVPRRRWHSLVRQSLRRRGPMPAPA
jgi:hypothetical protein